MPGPTLRTDIVDVYIFRREPAGPRFLQLHRCSGTLASTWHPVMGHINEGETAPQTALRELLEETQYRPRALWQLEQPNIYYLASHDCIVLGPCFAAEVGPTDEPVLNDEHDAHRWIAPHDVDAHFLWPGQRQAIDQILRDIIPDNAPVRRWMRLPV